MSFIQTAYNSSRQEKNSIQKQNKGNKASYQEEDGG
jgi:hypothetical protein